MPELHTALPYPAIAVILHIFPHIFKVKPLQHIQTPEIIENTLEFLEIMYLAAPKNITI